MRRTRVAAFRGRARLPEVPRSATPRPAHHDPTAGGKPPGRDLGTRRLPDGLGTLDRPLRLERADALAEEPTDAAPARRYSGETRGKDRARVEVPGSARKRCRRHT